MKLRNIISRIEDEIKQGMNPRDAITKICNRMELSENGHVYRFLLEHFGLI